MSIQVENLRKTFRVAERQEGRFGALKTLARPRYRTVSALDGVSFEIGAGELVGYIGPNGAGKSTTVKTLSGILVPDSGTCRVIGFTPWLQRREYVGRIGVVFGQRSQLWWDLPVVESFELLRDIYRVLPADYARLKAELCDRLDLGSFLDIPVRQLSLGQRMRCEIAASLLHSPPILFLDEPTIGLDATSKLAVRDFIKTRNREAGVTVILTTHDMDDIETLCSRVMVIAAGKILSDGTLDALRERVSRERRLTVDFESLPAAFSEEAFPAGVSVREREGNRVTFSFDPQKTPTAALIAQMASRFSVRDLLVQNPPIEEIIAALYRNHTP